MKKTHSSLGGKIVVLLQIEASIYHLKRLLISQAVMKNNGQKNFSRVLRPIKVQNFCQTLYLYTEKEISPLRSYTSKRGSATNFLLISKQLRKDSGHAIVEPQKRSSISETLRLKQRNPAFGSLNNPIFQGGKESYVYGSIKVLQSI